MPIIVEHCVAFNGYSNPSLAASLLEHKEYASRHKASTSQTGRLTAAWVLTSSW